MSEKQIKEKRIGVVAKEFGVAWSTLRSAVDRGEIDCVRTGCGQVLLDPARVRAWLADDTRKPGRKPVSA